MKKRYWIMAAAVMVSAFLQAYAMNTFLEPVQLLPSGFTGIASLLSRIAGAAGIHFSTSLGMVVLNIPVAIFCYRHIGKRFVIFSMVQVMLSSILLQVLKSEPLFDDVLLNICFGGFLYGLAISIALKGNASTAGMDFIALYVSNRIGKSIWQYVFVFNCVLLCLFGMLFGWEHAGYSILFQFIATKTIDNFYHRFKRVTLQVTTQKPKELVKEYISFCKHGISVMEGYGGYSGKKMGLLHTVVSTYEVQDIIFHLKQVDPSVIINVMPTETFVGSFYQKPLD
ncbi:MAG: YitT family protein [Lachnospiraceae bacterium]|nr:YitT family protein [Lachnospiraceae bacterium]MCI9185476.1 YitT family protein [Lachnospiraceae bacterium]